MNGHPYGSQLKHYTKMITARSYTAAACWPSVNALNNRGLDNEGKMLSSTELLSTMATGTSAVTYHSHIPVIVDNTLYMLGGINKDGFNSSSPGVFTAPLDSYSANSSAEVEHNLRHSMMSFCSWKCKWHTSTDSSYIYIYSIYIARRKQRSNI